MHVMFNMLCISIIAQYVVDFADTSGGYYYFEEQAGEEIPDDLQPAEEA